MRFVSRCRAVAAALLVCFAAASASAQLAQNGTTTSGFTWSNAALTQTVAHTTPSLANRLMLVAVHMNISVSTGTTVASVTYAGTPLTFGNAQTDAGPATRTELWFLLAPPTGANNVVVTLQNITAGQSVQGVTGITTYVDVDQALTGSLTYTNAGNNATPSSTLAGTAVGDMVFDFTSARENAAGTLTAAVGPGQTSLYNTTSPGPLTASDVVAVGSRETSTGANVTMSYNLNATARWSSVGGSIRGATTDVSITGYATPDLIDGTPTTVTFTFTIKANSAGANAINFSDTLPAGMSIVSAAPSQGTCTPGATTTCSIGTILNAGGTATVTLVATTGSGGVSTVYNDTATITVGTSDTNPADNSATVTVRTESHLCANPGKDGAAGTITGSVNTYWPGNANAAAGATSINLGAVPAGYGATAIGIGDLLLVMQMQDAAISSLNDDRYGDGFGTGGTGTAGSGSSNLNSAGRYEYVVATNAVPTTGGTLNFSAAGVGGGLIYSYTNAAASGTQGQRRFQVIRVPQYRTATLAAGTSGPAWNGAVGGVFAIDVAGTMTMGSGAGTGTLATTNGSQTVTGTGTTFTTQLHGGDPITISGQGSFTVLFVNSNTQLTLAANATATAAGVSYTVPNVSMTARGFRGGGGRGLVGGTGADTDYRTTAANNANAMKGEGFAGTPQYLFQGTGTVLNTTFDGYPNGSAARGAPGNAGGGGTDGDPAANDMNAGGAGGGNAGSGGGGGNAWSSAAASGGFGGSFEAPSTTRLVMGGGGGAGSTNNSTQAGAVQLGANGINSSGMPGGGIILIRANSISGSGTIVTNGESALDVANDAGGGGGAGGTIVIDSPYGSLGGLTLQARGGNGGNAWLTASGAGYPGNRHGPGGGGGGGAIFIASAASSTDVSGGTNGLTCNTPSDNFGAASGSPGSVSSPLAIIAGADAGFSCAIADLAVTNSDAPDPVTAGSNITYTQSLTNNGPSAADQVTFAENIPAGTAYQSMSVPPGWTCITPAVGGTGSITCTTASLLSGATANFSVVVQSSPGDAPGYVVTDTATASSRTTDSNIANNTASASTQIVTAGTADLAVTLTAPVEVVANANYNVTQVLKNNGGGAAANPTFSESTPPNTTFQGITPPAGWTCITPAIGGTGPISCSSGTALASGASLSFPLTLHVNAGTANGTIITETATSSTTSTDSYQPNNSGSTSSTVVGTGTADFAATITALTNPVPSGGNASFSETVTNNGVTAANATFTQNVPANSTFVSLAVPAGWSCTTPAVGGTGAITCTTTAVMAVGASATFLPVFNVTTGTAPGTTITQSVTVTAAITDSIASNNTASASFLVTSPTNADISVTKIGTPTPVGQGQLVSWVIKVTNNGPDVATNVTVNDTLPSANANFVSVSSSQGFCSGTIVCNLGTLAVRNTATIVVVEQTTTATTVTNTATASADQSDQVAANNSSTANIVVNAVTLVRLRDLTARQHNSDVLLTWQTSFESDNLGFNLYRDSGGQRVKINGSLIAGTALLAKKHDAVADHAYRFRDTLADAGAFVQYWLEDVDTSGRRTLHGPVSPAPGDVTQPANATPLPGLGADGSYFASPTGIGVVRPLALPAPTAAQTKQQFDLAADRGLKIYVTKEGWYRVPRAAMAAAGYDPGSDGRGLSLYVQGSEQPIIVNTLTDGTLDSIEFYGLPLDTISTGARTYWLRAGNGNASRIAAAKPDGGAPLAGSVPFTIEAKDRSIYFAGLINNGDNENFFGPLISPEAVTQTLDAGALDPSFAGNASLELVIQGATDQMTHVIDVAINGHHAGTAAVDNQDAATFAFDFPQSWLTPGANALMLTATNGDYDVSIGARTRLTVQHRLRADSGQLEATFPGGQSATVGGFTTSRVRAVDVTDPAAPIELAATIAADPNGGFAATFTPTGNAPRVVLAFDDSRVLAPAEMAPNAPSSWHDVKNKDNAALLIISNSAFIPAASTLVPVRQRDGISAAVIDVEDLYDEFNFGIRSPQAIRTFLRTTLDWKTPPRWVLLAGDASSDPRDYLGVGAFDFVPTKLIPTSMLKTASDDWLADFDGDGIADIAIGRIPVRTPEQAAIEFGKITSRGTPSGTWANRVVAIAERSSDFDFPAVGTSVLSLLPPSMNGRLLDLGASASQRNDIIAALNDGALLTEYIGHGSIEIWGDFLFGSHDAAQLANGNRLPFIVSMECLNGYFVDVYSFSLAEALLAAPNGGAVAVWASSSLTEPDPQAIMNRELVRQLFGTPGMTIGEAAQRAKHAVDDGEVRRTWILFGDPSMRLTP